MITEQLSFNFWSHLLLGRAILRISARTTTAIPSLALNSNEPIVIMFVSCDYFDYHLIIILDYYQSVVESLSLCFHCEARKCTSQACCL